MLPKCSAEVVGPVFHMQEQAWEEVFKAPTLISGILARWFLRSEIQSFSTSRVELPLFPSSVSIQIAYRSRRLGVVGIYFHNFWGGGAWVGGTKFLWRWLQV